MENQCESSILYGESMKIHGKAMKIINFRKKVDGESVEIHEEHAFSMEIQWKSMEHP